MRFIAGSVTCLLLAAAIAQPLTIHVCPRRLSRDAASAHAYHVSSLQEGRNTVRTFLRRWRGANDTALRSAKSRSLPGPVRVELCGGRHSVAEPLVLTAEDSGEDGAPVVYTSAPGSVAVLDGGYAVTGWVANASTGIWRAPIPSGLQTRQMWVNERRAVRARSAGPVFAGNITAAGYTVTIAQPCAGCPAGVPLASWLLAGAECVYQPRGASWTEPRCTITGTRTLANGSTVVTMAQPCFAVARGKAQHQNVDFPAFIENVFALLDEPGEWFAADGFVHYKPLPGEDPATAVAFLGTAGANGSAAAPVGANGRPGEDGASGSWWGAPGAVHVLPGAHHLHFVGLSFEHISWLGPSGPDGFVDLQSGFHFQGSLQRPLHGVPGAVSLHGAHNVAVSNCTFAHLGLSGVVSDRGSQAVVVTGSTFVDLSGSAVSVGNVSEPVLPPADQDRNITVSENHIRDTGVEYSGCAGIFAGYVAATDITHNDIADTSNGAVCVGWGWGAANSMADNRVVYNRIFRSNTVLYDCGSVYTLSAQPRSEVAYNFIADQAMLFGSLYHDAKSAFFHTHDNVVVSGPMWLCESTRQELCRTAVGEGGTRE